MPFDPKLIHAEEPPLTAAGELDLPADLAALAQQLGDDAANLAAKYPAAAARPAIASADQRGAFKYAAYILAGTAVAASLFAVLTWQSFPQSPTQGMTAAPTLAPTLVPSLSATDASSRPKRENVSLVDLSGPELEALFDLLDREPGRAGEVSF